MVGFDSCIKFLGSLLELLLHLHLLLLTLVSHACLYRHLVILSCVWYVWTWYTLSSNATIHRIIHHLTSFVQCRSTHIKWMTLTIIAIGTTVTSFLPRNSRITIALNNVSSNDTEST